MAKERKENDLQNLPACAAEFIKLVIKKMRYRKKVRRDVQAELAAHFEDELQSCKTDDEKEQKAQRLIEQFGDVNLLGILLRRAKKRCRPLWRTMAARTFQTISVLILCLTAYMVWFLSGRPVVTVDYVAELNRLVRPTADESLNAAPLYNKAAELYKEKSSDEISKLLGTKYNEATDEQKQLIEKWLTDNHQTLELVIAGTKKPYYWRKYSGEREESGMLGILLPHLNEFRNLARALCWRAWLRAEQGQYKDAFGDTLACYRFGQHLRGDKFLIEQLVGMGLERLAIQTLHGILNKREMNSAALAALQQDFEQMVADENFTVSFKCEQLAMYDEIQRSFTASHHLGEGHIVPKHIYELYPEVQVVVALPANDYRMPPQEKKEPGWLSEFVSGVKHEICEPGGFIYEAAGLAKKGCYILFFHPDRRQTFQAAQELYDYWEMIAGKSPAQIRAEDINVEEETLEMIKGNILLEFLTPAIGTVIRIGHRNKADIESTLTIIALLRYRQDTGDYPESLDDLVAAGYLKHLPMDPWSDKPLVYKRGDDGFMLYGIGSNFKDDGGQVVRDDKGRVRKYADEGDWVFWPVPK